MGGRWHVLAARDVGPALVVQLTGVLVFMTIDAQELPIAAIGRIVVVIVVTVMHGQLLEVDPIEFPRAPPANPGVDAKRLIPVALLPLRAAAARLGDYAV